MYSGTPTNRVVLGEIFGGIVSDGDPSTWQRAQVDSYRLLPGTDFLMLKISANENVFNDEVNPEFDGHYADHVQLTLKVSPHVNVRLEDFQASGVLGYQHLGSETTFGSSGVFRLQTEDPAGTLARLVGSTAFAFCIELSQSYTSSLENYLVGDLTTANSPLGPNGPITQAQQDLVAQLWARHFDSTWKAAGPYSPEDVTRSMAFHASVLEILADFDGSSLGSIDLDAGDFKLINGYLLDVNDPSQELQVRMVANGFLSSLTTSYSGRLPRLLALTNEEYQDYLVEAVPEIHSVVLSFLGLMTLVFFRSRLRRMSETIR
jgi:hypothetical protein